MVPGEHNLKDSSKLDETQHGMGAERSTVLQRHRCRRGQRAKVEVRVSMKDRNLFKLDGRSREEGT